MRPLSLKKKMERGRQRKIERTVGQAFRLSSVRKHANNISQQVFALSRSTTDRNVCPTHYATLSCSARSGSRHVCQGRSAQRATFVSGACSRRSMGYLDRLAAY